MPTKPKKKRTPKQRSESAKKGWITRRRNIKNEKRKSRNLKKIVENLKPALRKKLTPKKKRKKETELQRLRRENKELKKKLGPVDEFSDWVDVLPIQYLRRDGSIAIEQCWLRHLGHTTDQLILNLKAAASEGDFELDMECQMIADEFDVPLHEVYTLFFSP